MLQLRFHEIYGIIKPEGGVKSGALYEALYRFMEERS